MNRVLAVAATLILTAGPPALAQTDIMPSPAVRLPQPPGAQGLPVADGNFIDRALAASRFQIDAGKLAAERAQDPGLRQAAGRILADHEDLSNALSGIAAAKGHNAAARGEGPEEGADRLGQVPGADFDKQYLTVQARVLPRLIDTYQRQSAETQDPDLRTFATARVLVIRREIDALKPFADRAGVTFDLLENPPQY